VETEGSLPWSLTWAWLIQSTPPHPVSLNCFNIVISSRLRFLKLSESFQGL
jgi:hypothetical protein